MPTPADYEAVLRRLLDRERQLTRKVDRLQAELDRLRGRKVTKPVCYRVRCGPVRIEYYGN